MKLQWCVIGSLVTCLLAAPACAQTQNGEAQQPQPQTQPQPQAPSEEPLQGDVETTEIGLGQTPAPVRAAIENWAQGAQIKEVKEVRQGTRIQYKAEIEREGRNLEVLVSSQGEVLRAGEDVGADEGIF